MTEDPMSTRAGRLENNRAIMVEEKASDDEIFYNQIETRLGLEIELRNEADERLADAYINSLAQYEAQGEYASWAPLSIGHLVEHEGVTIEEAGVVVTMAAREYPLRSTEVDLLTRFFNYLTTNTDTFDRVLVAIEREQGRDHTLDPDLLKGLVEDFLPKP